jgi:hypothetical protein
MVQDVESRPGPIIHHDGRGSVKLIRRNRVGQAIRTHLGWFFDLHLDSKLGLVGDELGRDSEGFSDGLAQEWINGWNNAGNNHPPGPHSPKFSGPGQGRRAPPQEIGGDDQPPQDKGPLHPGGHGPGISDQHRQNHKHLEKAILNFGRFPYPWIKESTISKNEIINNPQAYEHSRFFSIVNYFRNPRLRK